MKAPLVRAWPVHADCPPFKSPEGDCAASWLGLFIDMSLNEGWLPDEQQLAAGAVAVNAVGATVRDAAGQRCGFLISQQAMAAFFSQGGALVPSLAYLDHFLCDLVDQGVVFPERETRRWRGLGQLWVYRVRLKVLDFIL